MNILLSQAYIIVVDDDSTSSLITLDLLRLAGSGRCYHRHTVAQAITFAEKLPHVNLFLVDLNMPQQGGYELLAQVRGHETLEKAKIVALTASTQATTVERAKAFGFNGFIGKPLRVDEFAHQIQQILNGEEVWSWR